ncbi:MAG: helix-turn-helix domain-containing protein [Oscillospiraceae bacterium]|jgi:transcriptional regulator with XRE-family HTH domain|nr:helix-turn-helix domain-containing protein [Oscillospiraceae bacterium]
MSEFKRDVGKRIKEKRVAMKLSREEFSYQADISPKFLYDIESGRKGLSAENLRKVAQALAVSTDWLVGI